MTNGPELHVCVIHLCVWVSVRLWWLSVNINCVCHQEQYQKEQEKLKKEWEKAQLEVEEEERKHNEEVGTHGWRRWKQNSFSSWSVYPRFSSFLFSVQERRILEETVAPLSPSASAQRQLERMATAPFSVAEENNNAAVRGNVSLHQNGQKIHTGSEDQHASKLHFFQGENKAHMLRTMSTCLCEPQWLGDVMMCVSARLWMWWTAPTETGNVEDVISGPQPSNQPDAKCQKVNVTMINTDFNSLPQVMEKWSAPSLSSLPFFHMRI